MIPDLKSDLPSPARLQRMANVALNQLGHAAIDVQVEPREDGRVAIVLSEAWAYVFLAHLEAQAKQMHEQLRKAMYQARIKDARLQAEIQRATAEWEQREAKIRERYRELLAEGHTKRQAIRQIKRESGEDLTGTMIQSVVDRDPAKKQARQERKARVERERKGRRAQKALDRQQRDAEIVALRAQRLTVREIAARVGLSMQHVKLILRKRGTRDAQRAD